MAGLVESNTGAGAGSTREQQLLDVLGRFDGQQASGRRVGVLSGLHWPGREAAVVRAVLRPPPAACTLMLV